MAGLNRSVDEEPTLEEIERLDDIPSKRALELFPCDAKSSSDGWRTERTGPPHRSWWSESEVDVRPPSHRRADPAQGLTLDVTRGSTAHVKSVMWQCEAKQCDPLGLAEFLRGRTNSGQLSSGWKQAAKRLRISEFFARRISLLWPEDQAAAIRLSLMVGLF